MIKFKIITLLLISCQLSYAFIINGSDVKEKFPEVGEIYRYGIRCNVTKIGPKQFLTAAHCVDRLFNHINIRFSTFNRSLSIQSFHIHPSWTKGCGSYDRQCDGSEVGTPEMVSGRADIVLLNVKELTPEIPYIKVRKLPVPINSKVTIVGSGCDLDIHADNNDMSWIMRSGNSITTTENELKNSPYDEIKKITAQSNIITYGYGYDSKYSSLCPGDSGGPLLIKNKDQQWEMVGIATHYTFNKEGLKTGHSYTNLHTRLDIKSYHNIYDWIKRNIEK